MMDPYYLSLVNRGTAFTAKEKRYIDRTIQEMQEHVSQRQAIGLLTRVGRRFDYASEGVKLG